MSGFRDDFSGAESTVGYDTATGSLAVRQINPDTLAESDAGLWPVNDAMFTRAPGQLGVMTYCDLTAPGLPPIDEGKAIKDVRGVLTLSAPRPAGAVRGVAVLGTYYADMGSDLGWPQLYLTTLDGAPLDVIAGGTLMASLTRAAVAVEEFHLRSSSVFAGVEEDDYTVRGEPPLYLRIEANNSAVVGERGRGDVTCSVTADEAGTRTLHSHTYHNACPADGSLLLAQVQFSVRFNVFGRDPSGPLPNFAVFSWAPPVTPVSTVKIGDGDAGALAR